MSPTIMAGLGITGLMNLRYAAIRTPEASGPLACRFSLIIARHDELSV